MNPTTESRSAAVPDGLSLGAYLPSAERLRETFGLSLSPSDNDAYAALIVVVHLLRRERWRQWSYLPDEDLAELPRAAPPVPKGEAHQVVVLEVADNGRAHLEHITFTYEHLKEIVVPDALGSLAAPVRRSLSQTLPEPLPAALLCTDLRPRQMGSAYRGGPVREVPGFHDYRFHDALPRARDAVQGFLRFRNPVRLRVLAYAWPIRVGLLGASRVAVFSDGRGGLSTVPSGLFDDE